MALTYQESSNLMNDFDLRGKIKVACLKFADSIMIEAETVPAHNTRERWAQDTFRNPDMAAQQVHPPTVMDGAVQDAGVDVNGKSLVTDGALQGAVETVINKML